MTSFVSSLSISDECQPLRIANHHHGPDLVQLASSAMASQTKRLIVLALNVIGRLAKLVCLTYKHTFPFSQEPPPSPFSYSVSTERAAGLLAYVL